MTVECCCCCVVLLLCVVVVSFFLFFMEKFPLSRPLFLSLSLSLACIYSLFSTHFSRARFALRACFLATSSDESALNTSMVLSTPCACELRLVSYFHFYLYICYLILLLSCSCSCSSSTSFNSSSILLPSILLQFFFVFFFPPARHARLTWHTSSL